MIKNIKGTKDIFPEMASNLQDVESHINTFMNIHGYGEIRTPIFEATESFLFSTSKKTASGPHIRDSVVIKRVMILVVLALIPCYIFGAMRVILRVQS